MFLVFHASRVFFPRNIFFPFLNRGVIGNKTANQNIRSHIADASRCISKQNLPKECPISLLSLVWETAVFLKFCAANNKSWLSKQELNMTRDGWQAWGPKWMGSGDTWMHINEDWYSTRKFARIDDLPMHWLIITVHLYFSQTVTPATCTTVWAHAAWKILSLKINLSKTNHVGKNTFALYV